MFQSEIPKKLLEATDQLKRMIHRLPKDEFGDFVYKGADIEDFPSQRLRDFGSRF